MTESRWIAHGLIVRDGKLLVLRREHGSYLGGQWDVPGGSVENGETSREAAEREVLEETGIHASAGEELSRFTNLDTKGRQITFTTVTYMMTSELDSPVVINPEEHSDWRWIYPSDDADGLELVWHLKKTLLTYFRLSGG